MTQPKPTVFCRKNKEEAYPWHARFDPKVTPDKDYSFAIVYFDDGSSFDAYGGWRANVIDRKTVEDMRLHAEENYIRLKEGQK